MLAAEKDKYFSSVISFLENELLAPEPFYHQHRIMEWYRAGTVQHFIDANNKILKSWKRNWSLKNKTITREVKIFPRKSKAMIECHFIKGIS